MTSSAKALYSFSRRRRFAVALVIGILVLGVVVSLGVARWHYFGIHNIFDAVMEAEWGTGTVNKPVMTEKYKYHFVHGDYPEDGREMRYRSRYDMVEIVVVAPFESRSNCWLIWDEVCWKGGYPTKLEIWYNEVISDDIWISLYLIYDRRDNHFHQEVHVRWDGEWWRDNERVTTILSEYGVTDDYLRSKRDWLLFEEVLPDLLAANPGVKFTVEDWGRVTVTTDQHLS